MPFESVHPTSGVRRKRLLQRPTLRLGLHRREDMSTAKTRRTRPAASPACDITPPSFTGWRNSRCSTWFADGDGCSPDKSLSSFEIDDATFMECLVNDVGSPDDVPQRLHFLARTPPRTTEVVVTALPLPAAVSCKAKKKVTFASNGTAIKAKAKSMPDLVDEPPTKATSCHPELRHSSSQPEQKAGARNSFVFAAFSRLPFSTKRSGSFTGIAPSPVDQR